MAIWVEKRNRSGPPNQPFIVCSPKWAAATNLCRRLAGWDLGPVALWERGEVIDALRQAPESFRRLAAKLFRIEYRLHTGRRWFRELLPRLT